MNQCCWTEKFLIWFAKPIILATGLLSPVILWGAHAAYRNKQSDLLDWLPADLAATHEYATFRQHFAGDQFVLLSWQGCTLDDARLEQLTQEIQRQIQEQSADCYYESVVSAPLVVQRFQSLYADYEQRLEPEQILKRLRGSLIGPDGKQAAAMVVLTEGGTRELRRALDALRQVAVEHCEVPSDQLHIGGLPANNRALDEQSEQTLLCLAVLAGLVSIAVAWLCLRSPRMVGLIFFIAMMSALGGMALVHFVGGQMDAILMIMPTLLFVLTLSASIHMVNYYWAAYDGRDRLPAARALRIGWFPCALSALTTAIGLLALLQSSLQPVQRFGGYSSLGLLASLLLLLGFLPAALHCLNFGSSLRANRTFRMDRLAHGVLRVRLVVLTVGLLMLLACGLGLPRLKPSQRVVRLFSTKSRLMQDTEWLEQRLGGLLPLEIVVRMHPQSTGLNFLQRLELVGRLEEAVSQLENVSHASSLATFSPPVPIDTRSNWLERAVISQRLEKQRDELVRSNYLALESHALEEREMWRISVRTSSLAEDDYSKLVDQVDTQLEPILERYRASGCRGISAGHTGVIPLLQLARDQLLDSLMRSLLFAFVIISFVMVLVLRSLLGGLVAMIPNVFPVMILLGGAGWLGVPIDASALLTASVAMGVAVDDTVHFLTWFRRGSIKGGGPVKATLSAYRSCSRAIVQTTAVAGLGLLMLGLSSFAMTRQFGILMFVLLLLAVMGDLVLLPALLSGYAGRRIGRLMKHESSVPRSPRGVATES